MELWIRSQDKRILQKVDNIYLNANYENRRICTIDSTDYESDLGEYKTKERALEVLDEIQKFIEEFNTVTAELDEYGDVTNVEHHKKVFEMPID